MTISHNTLYDQEALDALLQQFKGKENLEGLMNAFMAQLQEIEDCAWDLVTLRDLDSATGEQLDLLGKIINRARAGKDDDEYRIYLRGQVLVNRSSGTPEEMLDLIRLLTSYPPTADITIQEWYPARFGIYIGVDIGDTDPAALLDILELAKAGAVAVFIEYVTDLPAFAFDGALGDVDGFGDTGDPLEGGTFASLIGL